MPVREAICLLLGLLLTTGLPSLHAQESHARQLHSLQQADIDESDFTTPEPPLGRIVAVETLTVAGELTGIAGRRAFDVEHADTGDSVEPLRDTDSGAVDEPSLPLLPRLKSSGSSAANSRSAGRSPIWTVASSLTMVVGLFLLTVWGARRHLPQAATPLPDDVVRVLGRAPLAHRQTMQLVRVGSKLVLLCVTPQGAETLAEIRDPDEVDRLTASCDPDCPDAMRTTFRQVLAQVNDSRFPAPRSEDAQEIENPYAGHFRS